MQKILSLIKQGESQTVELKSSFQKEVIESVVAFANTKGGKIFIGVKDDGRVIGVDIKSETLKDWTNQIKNNTQPQLIVDMDSILIEDRVVVIVDVQEYPVKPIAYKSRYYKRVQNSNHLMDLMEITNMNLQSLQLSWDSYPANDTILDDLDTEKIDSFFEKVINSGRFRLSGDRKEKLQKLNLLKGDKPTNAAKLLFTKEQTVYNIHLGRFKTPDMILDDKMLKLTLYEAVEETIFYLLSHIKVAFEFTGEIQRTEIFEYPKKALRELVLNAIIHRDYTSPIDIQIKIFDNKITFFNPGKLYGDMTIEKLKTDSYQAQTRNKLIAEAFYLTDDVEKYGTGYIRVRREISNYPTMKLDFEEMGNGYLVTLSYEEQKTTQKTTPKTTQKTTPKTTPKTTKEKLIDLIKTDSKITRNELAKELNISINTVKEYILNLKREGLLKRVGSNRSGYWEVLDDI